MQIKKKIAIAAVMLGAVACGTQEKETPTGKKFSIVESGNGAAITENNIVEFTLNISTTSDSTLFDITETGREFAAVKVFPDSVVKQQQAAGQPADPLGEMIAMMSKGDSAEMKIIAADFFGKMAPPFIKDPSQEVVVGIRTVNVFADEAAYRVAMEEKQAEMMKKMEEEAEKHVETDDQLIQDYLTDNNISGAQKTASGLYYVITEEGNGETPVKGATVKVHYTGTLLDGQKFDSSVDRGQPFEFPLGQGRVIAGWDEGFTLLSKGTKATLFIPSGLAYGANGAGSMIKPFSVLKFDVELIDFVAPAQ
ncbi:FKBP-type peptidyl-prolyl cis-trans isomerase [Flammeovirga aprica]|uniref:Peptidyl-prolyl cis-trans isomerase n=1 Tax=Flammeovirga aprica JL-4 TaxID=694437 RepID=A0A7X9XC92_9BACT|nr:FKBP-type peptidyl-prolyl cis-trans isomerase [Flammeovirga aprica]NME71503.1 FKBP-type peptidyl-prolyl cis-trans isomerase [Flammeovirga aprica JL-4]